MKYDHYVITKKLTPPFGGNNYVSTAKIHEIGLGEITHEIGEIWSETEIEGQSIMNEKITHWIENN